MLASYFQGDSNHDMYTALVNHPNIKTLALFTCINVILSDHRRRLGLPESHDLLLYLAIDDADCILSHRDDGWTAGKGRSFIHLLFITMSTYYCQGSHFFVIVLAGAATSTVYSLPLNRPIKNFAGPLLSMDQSVQLAQEAFRRANIAQDVLDKFDWFRLKLLLSDVAGVPRNVWYVINGVLRSHLCDVNFEQLQQAIKSKISAQLDIFKSKYSSEVFLNVIHAAILRENRDELSSMDAQVYRIKQTVAWSDLENEGILYLSKKEYQGTAVLLPFLHLEYMVESFAPFLAKVIGSLRECKSWKTFVASHDALLLTLYRMQRRETVSVYEYYRYAVIGSDAKYVDLVIPKVSTNEDDSVALVQVERLAHRFPESSDGALPHTNASVVYLNADGAQLDVVVAHKVDTSRPVHKGALLYRGIHCKYVSAGHTEFVPSEHAQSLKITKSTLARRVAASPSFLHVYITNSQVKRHPIDRSVEGCVPADAVFVTRDQLDKFFTPTFVDRIRSTLAEQSRLEGLAGCASGTPTDSVDEMSTGSGYPKSKAARLV